MGIAQVGSFKEALDGKVCLENWEFDQAEPQKFTTDQLKELALVKGTYEKVEAITPKVERVGIRWNYLPEGIRWRWV